MTPNLTEPNEETLFSKEKLKNKAPKPRSSQTDNATAQRVANRKLEKELREIQTMLESVQGLVYISLVFKNSDDAAVIEERFPAVIASSVKLCRTDAQARKYFLRACYGTVYGELFVSVVMLILPILSNHGLVPSIMSKIEKETSYEDTQTHTRKNGSTNTPFGLG